MSAGDVELGMAWARDCAVGVGAEKDSGWARCWIEGKAEDEGEAGFE